MEKRLEDLGIDLIKASELSPLETGEVRCLCSNCGETLFPERKFKRRVKSNIAERCEICGTRCFEIGFIKRRSPLVYLGETGESANG